MNKNVRKKSIKNQGLLFIGAYFGIGALITLLVLIFGDGRTYLIGEYCMYSGIALIILGIIFKGEPITSGHIRYLPSEKVRANESLANQASGLIVIIGLALLLTGYLLNKYIFW